MLNLHKYVVEDTNNILTEIGETNCWPELASISIWLGNDLRPIEDPLEEKSALWQLENQTIQFT